MQKELFIFSLSIIKSSFLSWFFLFKHAVALYLGFALKFWQALKKEDFNFALREMQVYFAGLPYVDGFLRKLENVSNWDGFCEWSMMLLVNILNVCAHTLERCIGDRADIVIKKPDPIYVIELKVNGTAQETLDQIEKNGYATPYLTDGRNVVRAGVKFLTKP